MDLDFVGVSELEKGTIESVSTQFIQEGIFQAREKSWSILHKICSELKEGITEDEARKLAQKICRDHGILKHWHRPYIRLGAGTALTFHDPMQTEYRLQPGDPYYVDLGPIIPDPGLQLEYEGDVGDTFVYGENKEAEKLAGAARELFRLGKEMWRTEKLSGAELYRFLKERTSDLGYTLVEKVDGHRLSDFPHHKYTKERLAHVKFHPTKCLWVLELQILHPTQKMGAFYEDLLF